MNAREHYVAGQAPDWRTARPGDRSPRPRIAVENEVGRTFYTLAEIEESHARGYRDGKAYGWGHGLAVGIVAATLIVGASCTWVLHLVGVL